MLAAPRAIAALAALAALATTPACTDAAPPTLGPIAARTACRAAVIASDYRSSTLSLVTPDGTVCAPDLLDSGSRPPGLLTALSGDVVVPSGPTPDGQIYLLDRYPNAVLTRVDAASGAVLSQLALSPGFTGNPQDLITLDAHTALVSRLQPNPEATDDPDARGSDLLYIDLDTNTRAGTLSLDAHHAPGFDPQPTQLARLGDTIWVGLGHLSSAFDTAGPGRIVAVDPIARTVLHQADLADFANCGHLAATAPDVAEPGIWVVCSGLFKKGGAVQLGASGVAFVGPDGDVVWSGRAADLGGHPFGFGIAALSATRVLVVAVGDLATHTPDQLLVIDREAATQAGTATPILRTSPFTLGQIAITPQAILVADADPRTPVIHRFARLPDALPTELGTTLVSRTGLPPRAIAMYLTP